MSIDCCHDSTYNRTGIFVKTSIFCADLLLKKRKNVSIIQNRVIEIKKRGISNAGTGKAAD